MRVGRRHRLIVVPTTSSQIIHCDYDITFTDVHGVQKCPARQFFGFRQASVQKILKHCFFACCQHPQCFHLPQSVDIRLLDHIGMSLNQVFLRSHESPF